MCAHTERISLFMSFHLTRAAVVPAVKPALPNHQERMCQGSAICCGRFAVLDALPRDVFRNGARLELRGKLLQEWLGPIRQLAHLLHLLLATLVQGEFFVQRESGNICPFVHFDKVIPGFRLCFRLRCRLFFHQSPLTSDVTTSQSTNQRIINMHSHVYMLAKCLQAIQLEEGSPHIAQSSPASYHLRESRNATRIQIPTNAGTQLPHTQVFSCRHLPETHTWHTVVIYLPRQSRWSPVTSANSGPPSFAN